MPEPLEDIDIPLIRHEVPKRRLNNKFIQRYRKIYHHQGIISKILMIEGPFSDENHFEDPNDQLYNRLVKHLNNDNSGLSNFNIMYSIGKRKRWLVAKEYSQSLPDPLDFSLESTYMIRFEEYQTLHQSLICDLWGTLATRWGWNPCMRYYGSKVRGYSVRQEDQKQENHVGGYSTRFKIISPTGSFNDKPNIHVQYHIREYKLNRKIHNCDKWICYPSHGSGRKYPYLEGCKIGRDVLKIDKEQYETGLFELNGKFKDDDFHEFEEVEIQEDSRRVKDFILGDFIVKRIPQRIQKKIRKSNHWEDWEILS